MKRGKKFELDSIISKFKDGKKAKEVSKELRISNSNLSYYLGKLKKRGILKYKGFGIWVVQKSLPTQSTNKEQKPVRGHAFIWKIKFEKHINWEEKLKQSKIDYKLQSNGKVFRIFFNGRKIWLKEKGMIIYEPFNFWGSNSYESKGKAVYNLDRLIKNLFFKLKISEIPYKFTTSREHFALVKNELARQYNSSGEKLYVEDEGGVWMWIDFSHGVDELENNNVDINKSVQDYWNDHKRHNFKVTPSFIMERINQVTENQMMFAQNLESHIEAIKTLSKVVKELEEGIKRIGKW
jgi:hypothetical protein